MRSSKTLQIPGYQVMEYLGSGAKSTIWSIRHLDRGDLFALKRVVREGPSDYRFVEQAINEFGIARQLDHPAIRKCLDMRRVRRLWRLRELLLIMEFCPGVSVQQQRPASVLDTLTVFDQVADALNHMHSRGLLHADMKPNNIIVAPDGKVKVIDLGQGCPVGTVKERIQGTPDFIAPEQVHRRPLDARTDVFNFGAALYWTLTGQAINTVMPKRSDSIQLKNQLNVKPASELNSDVPPALDTLVADCVEFQPSKRPASMQPVQIKLQLISKQLRRQVADAPDAQAKPDRES